MLYGTFTAAELDLYPSPRFVPACLVLGCALPTLGPSCEFPNHVQLAEFTTGLKKNLKKITFSLHIIMEYSVWNFEVKKKMNSIHFGIKRKHNAKQNEKHSKSFLDALHQMIKLSKPIHFISYSDSFLLYNLSFN